MLAMALRINRKRIMTMTLNKCSDNSSYNIILTIFIIIVRMSIHTNILIYITYMQTYDHLNSYAYTYTVSTYTETHNLNHHMHNNAATQICIHVKVNPYKITHT